jgi:hypothetical protein
VVYGFPMQLTVAINAIKPRVSYMTDGRYISIEMKRDYGGCHASQLRQFEGHLINGTVGPLDSRPHYLFGIYSVGLVSKRLGEYLYGHLRCNIAGLSTAYAISHGEDPASIHFEEGVLVLRALVA